MGYWLGNVGMLSNDMFFNLGSATVCSPAIFEAYFPYHKDTWIAVTVYNMCFCLIVLFLLTAILHFIILKAT